MLKYATIGTSQITEEFINGATLAGGMELAAVYSRSAEKGKSFADRFGAPAVYTDLEQMARSDIDAVYIASPNSLHFSQSRLFLLNNKNAICEKPATVTPAELEELQSLAERRGLVYMEAMMFMHTPAKTVLENALKKIGKITSAHFDFSQLSSKYSALKRGELPNIFNPEMAGGCLMDLGCYCVYPAVYFFGEPSGVSASAGFHENGADLNGSAVLDYMDKLVTLTYSKISQSRLGSEIMGDEGTVTIKSISKLTGITLYLNNEKSVLLVGEPPKAQNMGFEARAFYEFCKDLQANWVVYEKARNTALGVSRLMDRIRQCAWTGERG